MPLPGRGRQRAPPHTQTKSRAHALVVGCESDVFFRGFLPSHGCRFCGLYGAGIRSLVEASASLGWERSYFWLLLPTLIPVAVTMLFVGASWPSFLKHHFQASDHPSIAPAGLQGARGRFPITSQRHVKYTGLPFCAGAAHQTTINGMHPAPKI